MKLTTIIIEIASIVYIIFGVLVLFSKGLRKNVERSNAKDINGYIAFNGKFNLILGIIGVVIGGLDYFLPSLTKVWIGVFLVIMIFSSVIQGKMSKRFIK
ncbi:hypothetical protein JHL18_06545 [Clostridium sp. YIM B02505]|uniref:DUF3784 domain-containing protein n=1 Tax=Clostridium yunnanense TaxID=2800325 RepID=A0ABS1ELQ2_9CLOT|nr:hypothetical protein [Clostridium yunnanense]MBK1810290.1 hypothetical protein [Clostridium yunnanense]